MSKDPAFLFYPNDYMGGTMGMTLEEKGAYMELLVLQYNKGKFTINQAKKSLNGSFEMLWPELKDKFIEEDGFYYNQRLEKERHRRRAFIEKQSEVGKKGGRPKKTIEEKPTLNPDESQTKPNPFQNQNPNETILENENDNIDSIVIEDIVKEEESIPVINSKNENVFSKFPSEKDLSLPLPEIKIGAVIQLMKISKQLEVTVEKVNGFWHVFKIQNFNGKTFYPDVGKVYSHFINWMKSQDVKNNQNANSNNHRKLSRGEAGQHAVLNDIRKDFGMDGG